MCPYLALCLRTIRWISLLWVGRVIQVIQPCFRSIALFASRLLRVHIRESVMTPHGKGWKLHADWFNGFVNVNFDSVLTKWLSTTHLKWPLWIQTCQYAVQIQATSHQGLFAPVFSVHKTYFWTHYFHLTATPTAQSYFVVISSSDMALDYIEVRYITAIMSCNMWFSKSSHLCRHLDASNLPISSSYILLPEKPYQHSYRDVKFFNGRSNEDGFSPLSFDVRLAGLCKAVESADPMVIFINLADRITYVAVLAEGYRP